LNGWGSLEGRNANHDLLFRLDRCAPIYTLILGVAIMLLGKRM
jgi:hypothetical protein